MAFPFAVAGAGLSLVGGLFGGGKAARGARRLAGAENAVRRLQVARSRASQIREANQALGQQAVSAAGSGVESSSAVTGRATLLNQLSSNLNFINQSDKLGQKAGDAQRMMGQGNRLSDFSNEIGGFIGSFG